MARHVASKWADKYKGKFDDGWDTYRERVFKRQLEMGIIPPGTKLTERDKTLEAWADIPESQRAFQRRLMEIFAGYVEHTDAQVGRLMAGLEERGLKENTLVFYIFGDNGSSAEGQDGSISELLAQNNMGATVDQQIKALDRIGGLSVLGTSKTDNMYHAGWAWAGSTPFKGTKLMGSYFGGTRNPMVVSWPGQIEPDQTIRSQFHYVIDIAPTIYELLKIPAPEVVNGYEQIPMDGISLAYTFDKADAAPQRNVQFFDNNGSRAIYKDGWMASTFGPLIPWDTPASAPCIKNWDSNEDEWELYNINEDFSQANNLAQDNPEKLKKLKEEFMALAKANQDFPIGAGLWLRSHPEDVRRPPYTSWTFTADTRRMPEFAAPGLGKQSNKVTMEVEVDDGANGVLYALGGAGGGLALYMKDGHLIYEYNLLLVEQYTAKSDKPLKAGKYRLDIVTEIDGLGKAGTVTLAVDDQKVGIAELKRTVPVAFTATETFDVGIDLGSPVSHNYFDQRPFAFTGKIGTVTVALTGSGKN